MDQKHFTLSQDARRVLHYIYRRIDPIDRNQQSIVLGVEMLYSLPEFQINRALRELLDRQLIERDVRWYNLTPLGHQVAKLPTDELNKQYGTGALGGAS